MKKYKIDDNTIWEDTYSIRLHNYPAPKNTFSYICKVYREYKNGLPGYTEVEGNPLYFHEMNMEQISLAIIMATAEITLINICKFDENITASEKRV